MRLHEAGPEELQVRLQRTLLIPGLGAHGKDCDDEDAQDTHGQDDQVERIPREEA